MPAEYNPSFAEYDPKDSGKPMIEAVAELASQTGEDPKDFIGRSMQQIFNLAEETYDELPEFWRIWKEWHAPQPKPEMGDL